MGDVEGASLYHGLECNDSREDGTLQTPAPQALEVAVDRALCVGSGPCFVLAPAAFALDDTMKAIVLDPEAENEESILEAARECPTQAIYVSRGGRPLYP